METLSTFAISNNNAILLVDDEFDIITTIEQLLKKQGFNVFGFTSPFKALEHFQANSGQFGLVISDLRMPEMNGYEFTKKVKEIKPEVKVFFMTAFEIDNIEFKKVLPFIKIDELIQKPLSFKNLTSIINKYIKNETKHESKGQIIDNLDLPDGLKELLNSHGFTTEQLLNMKSNDIADTLGIDQDAARVMLML